VHVTKDTINSLAAHGVVSARTELRSEAIVKDKLSGGLGGNGNTESHPGELEGPSDDVKVSGSEDEGDDGGVGDSRGTCLGRKWLEMLSFRHVAAE
jgi:hypothetical protein